MSLFFWPPRPHAVFSELAEKLEDDTAPVRPVELGEVSASANQGDTVVLILAGSGSRATGGLQWLRDLSSDDGLNVIAVVDDSYLGSGDNRGEAQVSGAAVAAVRSLAVQRGTTVRANAICVPEGLTGVTGELRGPLPDDVEVDDVVSAIGLLAGPDGGYLSGQVLFVDGGRHLFSSLTA